METDAAFQLAVRVHRGGGYTKDYLYLNGVARALETIKSTEVKNLFVGKTSFPYLSIINEMVDRQLVCAPRFVPQYLHQPAASGDIIDYLIRCIRYDTGAEACSTPVESLAISA